MTVWIAIMAGMFLIAGAVGAKRSLRARRLDDHALCRRCRFDLHGVYPESETCPECAADLTGPRAIRVGNRRISWPKLSAASVVVLLSLTVIAYIAAARIDQDFVQSIKPDWLLEIEIDRGSNTTASAALKELVIRIEDDALSEARITRLADCGPDEQEHADDASWDREWAEFLNAALTGDRYDEVRYARFLRNGIAIRIPADRGIPASGAIDLTITVKGGRVGFFTPMHVRIELISAELDGAPVPFEDIPAEMIASGLGQMVTRATIELQDSEPGDLVVVWRVQMLSNSEPLVVLDREAHYRVAP